MPELYPLFFTPVFKHYLWGGRNLETIGRDLPNNQHVAESWEIASHADGMTVISNGHHAGKTLPELLSLLGSDLVGRNNQWALDRGIFPLMVKLLDAEDRLSVQVHPDDMYAKEHEGASELGKAEMWVVLSAKPGSGIIYGFAEETTPAAFHHAVRAGSLEPCLNFIPVKAGDHVCVPPGTLHAILEGVMLAEIQQNSNTTYRVYDWNRVDDQGQARDLHVTQALDVINFQQINAVIPAPESIISTPDYSREKLCRNTYFTTERFTFRQRSELIGNCDGSSLEIWGVIEGHAKVAGENMEKVKFCVLPAAMGEFSILADENSVLLRVLTDTPAKFA